MYDPAKAMINVKSRQATHQEWLHASASSALPCQYWPAGCMENDNDCVSVLVACLARPG